MPDTARLKELKQRRDTLITYLDNEKKSKKKSDKYIEDLLSSVESCDAQISPKQEPKYYIITEIGNKSITIQ